MPETSGQDEARRALADSIEVTFECQGQNMAADIGTLVIANLPAVLAALRAPTAEQHREPPPGLLMSMALRYDHGLGMPGYYDQEMFCGIGGVTHAQRLEGTLTTMRQLWEEVTGSGFYKPAAEADYAARLAKLRALPVPADLNEGGGK